MQWIKKIEGAVMKCIINVIFVYISSWSWKKNPQQAFSYILGGAGLQKSRPNLLYIMVNEQLLEKERAKIEEKNK